MYRSSRFKKIKFSKYATNPKTMISQRKLIIPILILYLSFLFFIDLIHNIIYTSVLLDQKFHHQWQCSKVVTWYRRRHVTNKLLWSHDSSLRFSKFYIYELSYNFNTFLYQFLETGTSDKTFMGRDQELKWLAFSLYSLSFFLYSPFKA